MALQSYPGALGPDHQSSSYIADSERTINCYAQPVESASAPTPWVMIPTPGFTTLTVVSQAPGRANFSENGRNFAIFGFALIEYFASGATILRGTVASDANPGTITGNGDAGGQLFITSGDVGYCYDLTANTLTTVLASGARMGAYLDGYFLALDTTTSTLQVSDLLNGLVWNPLQIAQRLAGSDRWQAMYVVNRLIYLLGSATSEVWWNAGTSPFPFAPIQEAFSEFGIAATFSGAVDTSLTFLGRNANGRGIVFRMQGYVPQRVSTHSEEIAIQRFSRMDDAVGGITQQQGRPVYVLTFPTADQTLAFDEGTTLWHRKEYWNHTTATAHAYRGMFFAALPNLSVCCDRQSGHLLIIDTNSFVDVDGNPIQRIREMPRLAANQARFTVNRLQLVMDVGIGLNPGFMTTGTFDPAAFDPAAFDDLLTTFQTQGTDPQIMLQTSRDGGKVWGFEQWRSAGKIGAYNTRVTWDRQGQARNFVPRFTFTDPVPFRWTDCLVDVSPGMS